LSRVIKPKSLNDGQWQKNEGGKPQRRPKTTFDILLTQVQGRQGRRQGARNPDHPESQTRQSDFPKSGQDICSWELVRQAISDHTQQHSEGRERHRQDYHLAPHFPIGPPIPGPWGPPPMKFPPCPPWWGGTVHGCHHRCTST
jgi:hypothetical protein